MATAADFQLKALSCYQPGTPPRAAELVPAATFWRSKDVYSDHMVRAYHVE